MPEMNVQDVPLAEILVDQNFNCRQKIRPVDVANLALDIDKNGLLNPVNVTALPDGHESGFKYKLIAGFRRTLAMQQLQRETIPATVMDVQDETEQRFINLSENLNREDLTVLEEARALKPLFDQGLSDAVIMERLSIKRGYCQIRRYLLSLPPDTQLEVEAGKLTQSDVRDLYTVLKNEGKNAMYSFAKACKSAREKGGRKKPQVKSGKKSSKRKRERAEIFQMQDYLRVVFGNGFPTRILAWAAGEIADEEIDEDIKAQCAVVGVTYRPREN